MKESGRFKENKLPVKLEQTILQILWSAGEELKFAIVWLAFES
jgi:hypothetical protein